MPRLDPFVAELRAIKKTLAKSKPEKAHGPLYHAFRIALLAGDATRARRVLDLLYGDLPPAKKVVTALSTHAVDVVCHVAGFGDRTSGKPTFVQSLVSEGTLPERVAAIAGAMRLRLARNSYDGDYPTDDAWRDRAEDDPWRAIDRFRRIQALYHPDRATAASEADALTRLDELFTSWPLDAKGAGMGAELAIAFDLELGSDPKSQRVGQWLAAHGPRLQDGLLVDNLLCLPAVTSCMLAGGFRSIISASDEVLAQAFAEVFTEASCLVGVKVPPTEGKGAPRDRTVLKVQKRTVGGEYSQIHLEPAERSAAEAKQVYFQDPRESAQGMSLFPTMVALATPSETESVDVELTAKPAGKVKADLGAAVQAVAFPLEVRGPIVVRSVSSSEDVEPLIVLPGRYDVLALFLPKGRKTKKTSLRRFVLRLTLLPAGALHAPVCYRLEDGSPHPEEIFSH